MANATEAEPKRFKNPVVVVIDQGHYMKTLENSKVICRADAEEYPCSVTQAAEEELRQRLKQWHHRPNSIERPTVGGVKR